MSDLAETTMTYDAAVDRVNVEKPEFGFALRRRKNGSALKGLVVSPDDRVRREFSEILRECGLAAVLASTVTESARILSAHNVFVVLCQDCMADGGYGDLVQW